MLSPVSINQIARLVGVSRTTVSLALRGDPKVSALTRDRVRAMADRLGYLPNPLVTAHMVYVRTARPLPIEKRLAFVSHLSPEEMEACIRMPHRVYLRAARARAHVLGYELEPHRLEESRTAARRLGVGLLERKVAGVLLPPFNDRGPMPALELDLRPFAAVMIEQAFIEPRLHKVSVDQLTTIGRLIQRMLDYGYSRIGIALPRHMDEHANHSWLAGYQTFQEFCPADQRVPHFISPEWDQDSFLAWFERWRPEAIITIDPDIVHWLREARVNVPGEVACATLSWTEQDPEMSGFHQNWETLGSVAVDQVAAQLFRNERGPPAEQRTLLVEAIWREGATLPCRAPPKAGSALRLWVH